MICYLVSKNLFRLEHTMRIFSLLIIGTVFWSIQASALDYEDYIKFSEMKPTIENGIEICKEHSDHFADTCNSIKSFYEGICLTGDQYADTCREYAKTLPIAICLTGKQYADTCEEYAKTLPIAICLTGPQYADTCEEYAKTLPIAICLTGPQYADTCEEYAKTLPIAICLTGPQYADTCEEYAKTLKQGKCLAKPKSVASHCVPDSE